MEVCGKYLTKLARRADELSQATTQEEADLALSRWQEAIAKAMREWKTARERLLEKREAFTKFLDGHYAPKVAAIEDEDKRLRADEAVAKAEAARLEVLAAEDNLTDARHMEGLTRRTHGYMTTPRDLAKLEYWQAQADTADAATARNKAWAKLKPIDDQPDPKTGMPTEAKRKYLAWDRKWKAELRHEAYMKHVAENVPEHDEAVANVAAAEARLEAAAQSLKEANAERHSSLSMGRPAAQVSAEEVALAA
ncbi:hypothetical protein ASH00_15750 [Arthrobacter sp. Soil782]|nr:hypothetical protein ASH00_15750 [Arthrobacter sp. Soil782]